ncbi:MAG: hypothetical protein R3E96_15240 [Planctomycetota bacterium]
MQAVEYRLTPEQFAIENVPGFAFKSDLRPSRVSFELRARPAEPDTPNPGHRSRFRSNRRAAYASLVVKRLIGRTADQERQAAAHPRYGDQGSERGSGSYRRSGGGGRRRGPFRGRGGSSARFGGESGRYSGERGDSYGHGSGGDRGYGEARGYGDSRGRGESRGFGDSRGYGDSRGHDDSRGYPGGEREDRPYSGRGGARRRRGGGPRRRY